MKIIKTKYEIEMHDFFEKDVIGVDIPFYVTRLEYPEEIVWLGLNTNWKKKKERWYQLKNNKWVRCKTPKYETKFQELQSLEERL